MAIQINELDRFTPVRGSFNLRSLPPDVGCLEYHPWEHVSGGLIEVSLTPNTAAKVKYHGSDRDLVAQYIGGSFFINSADLVRMDITPRDVQERKKIYRVNFTVDSPKVHWID